MTDRAALIRVRHLARRFFGALSRKPPPSVDESWALGLLLPAEAALWQQMSNADRRHSIAVARRFVDEVGESPRDDVAAALLHDIGKLCSGLGTFARVIATIVGPRTSRFRRYHDHERLGAELLRTAGSTAQTVSLVGGSSDRIEVLAALRRADDL